MKKLTTKEVIEKIIKIHGDKYDYSKVNYVNNRTKICIVCPKHGEFMVIPDNFINKKSKCPICSANELSEKFRLTKEEVIKKSNIKHQYKYKYLDFEYINNTSELNILCPTHGLFTQKVCNHLAGCGCPKCALKRNHSEQKLYNFLLDNLDCNIIYQYKNQEILSKQSLDFYLPDYNIAIEYQGEQHFKPYRFKNDKNDDKFKKIINLDKRKYDICKYNNIKLLYFTYAKNYLIPKIYMDKIYTKEDEILKEILNYKNS